MTPRVELSHSWWEGHMTGFDLETSGKDPEVDEMVSYCVAHFDPGPRVREVEHRLVRPIVPIHPEASEIHGHTEQSLRDAGAMSQADGIDRVTDLLSRSVADQIPIVGMNLSYDLTLADRVWRRYGGEGMKIGDPFPVIDIRVIDLYIDPFRKGSRKLVDLCKHYGVSHHGAHDAQEDVLATCRVAWKIGRLATASHTELTKWYNLRRDSYNPRSYRGPAPWVTQLQRVKALAKLTVAELHQCQVEWAWEQRAHLQQHFRKTDPNAKVDPRWPLIPYQEPEGDHQAPAWGHPASFLPGQAIDGGDGDPNGAVITR